MKPPRQALVLAAGRGERLLPLTRVLPKALLPFHGKPLLGHTLERLAAWGVREVVVNLHHLAGEVAEWVRLHPVPGLAITLSHEPELLGTGGALARAAWFFGSDRPFWICNADVACRLDPRPLLRAFARADPLAVLWMVPDAGPRTVRVEEGRVTHFQDPRPGSPGTATFSGLHLVSPSTMALLPGAVPCSILEAYRRGLAAGQAVLGVTCPGSWWADLGTPEQVVQAHRETWPGHRPFVAGSPSVRIARGARPREVVLCERAQVLAGARPQAAVVGPDTRVRGSPSRLVVPAALALTSPEAEVVARAGPPLGPEWSAECLAPRGSDRTFFRLLRPGGSAIAMRHGGQRAENDSFVPLARFLARHHLPVPAVLGHTPDRRFVLQEDVGGVDLLAATQGASRARLHRLYAKVLAVVARLHGAVSRAARRRAPPLQPPFDSALYAWERELFCEHFLSTHGRRLTASGAEEEAGVLADLATLAEELERQPTVLVHRDLQSTNLLLGRQGPVLIDFQGMRWGPAAYDLASLLADPYVDLDPATQRVLARAYVDAGGEAEVLAAFSAAAVQRLAQALGAYGRLGARAETRRFLAHVPAALRQMERFARTHPSLPRVAAWAGKAARASAENSSLASVFALPNPFRG
jgi:NDP-sugar pyrophosphorylase family protein/aminoglycoside/choline kinase family phosphotransferase